MYNLKGERRNEILFLEIASLSYSMVMSLRRKLTTNIEINSESEMLILVMHLFFYVHYVS